MDRKTAIDCIISKNEVIFQDMTFYPTAYILRIRDNKWIHQLELHDLKANSVMIANMEEVEIKC